MVSGLAQVWIGDWRRRRAALRLTARFARIGGQACTKSESQQPSDPAMDRKKGQSDVRA
jgi:hypothetical protein